MRAVRAAKQRLSDRGIYDMRYAGRANMLSRLRRGIGCAGRWVVTGVPTLWRPIQEEGLANGG